MVVVDDLARHDDVIKWKHFPRYWPFLQVIHRNIPHKGQWRGALMFSLICTWINGSLSNRKAGDLRRHRAHYDVSVLKWPVMKCFFSAKSAQNMSQLSIEVALSLDILSAQCLTNTPLSKGVYRHPWLDHMLKRKCYCFRNFRHCLRHCLRCMSKWELTEILSLAAPKVVKMANDIFFVTGCAHHQRCQYDSFL